VAGMGEAAPRRRGRRLSLALCLLVLGASTPAVAAELTARAVVDRTRISIQDAVQLTVVVSGGDAAVDTTAIQDFQVTSRGQSSSVQIVNTHVTRETRFQFALVPRRTGSLVVPSLTVRRDGDEGLTDPIPILVTEASAAGDAGQEISLRAEVSDETPFRGQEVVYTLRLEAAVPIFDASYREPEFPGFLVRKLDDQKSRTEVRDGREVRVTEITYMLTPRETGKLTVGPATLSCQVLAAGRPGRRGDPFDDPFFRRQRSVEKVVRSPEVTVAVRQLPPAPAGLPFSGLVGEFSLSGTLTPPEVAVGDSATLSVVLQGRGNVEEAPSPEIAPPPGFKVYPDNPETEVKTTAAGTSGTKGFRFALVPTAAGDYRLGPVRMGFFNLKSGAYETLQAGPFPLRVAPGAAPPAAAAIPASDGVELPAVQSKRRVEQRGEDILDIHRNLTAAQPLPALGFPALAGLFGLPALVYVFLRLTTAAWQRERTVSERMRDRARRFMADAKTARRRGETAETLACLQRAVTAAVLGRAGRQGEVLTYLEAERLLGFPDVDPALCREVVEVLQGLDAARYGGGLTEDGLGEWMTRCEGLLKALGRAGKAR